MPNQEIDDFTELAVAPASGDLVPIVDVSDTTDSAQGTTKKVTVSNLLSAASGTFAGADFDKYRLIGVNARPNSTTTDAYGVAISPFQDTIANNDDASGPFIRRNTGASSGNSAGFNFNNGAFIWIDWLPQLFTKLKTFTDISSTRIWIGCFSGNPVGSDDPVVDAIGFRYSTGASDTTWKAYSNDSSGGGTVTDTGVTVSLGTVYLFAIVVESTSSVKFYISTNNGATFSLVATHTTNLPSGSMGDYYFVIETLTTAARGLNHSFTNIRMR